MIEALVVLGILGIISYTMTTTVANMAKEQRALQEKFSLLELKQEILAAIGDSTICTSFLNKTHPILNLNLSNPNQISPTVISYSDLRMGNLPNSPMIAVKGQPLPGYPPKQMVVEDIQFKNIVFTGIPNSFMGDLVVSFLPESMTRSLKPVVARVTFTVKPMPTLATSEILNCTTATQSPPGTLCGSSTFLGGPPLPSGFSSLLPQSSTCQGMDPAKACPAGYTKKILFFWFTTCVKD